MLHANVIRHEYWRSDGLAFGGWGIFQLVKDSRKKVEFATAGARLYMYEGEQVEGLQVTRNDGAGN